MYSTTKPSPTSSTNLTKTNMEEEIKALAIEAIKEEFKNFKDYAHSIFEYPSYLDKLTFENFMKYLENPSSLNNKN